MSYVAATADPLRPAPWRVFRCYPMLGYAWLGKLYSVTNVVETSFSVQGYLISDGIPDYRDRGMVELVQTRVLMCSALYTLVVEGTESHEVYPKRATDVPSRV